MTPARVADHAFTSPREIVVDTKNLYLTAQTEDGSNEGTVWALSLAAPGPPSLLTRPQKKPWGMALGDDGELYFADVNNASVCRVPITSGKVELLASASGGNGAIAVEAGFFYWARAGAQGDIFRVRRR